jgi:hypothetical protein
VGRDSSRYSDSLRAGRSGDRIPLVARFFAPVQTGPGAYPASCTMDTGSFPRRGRDVELYLYSPSGSSWPVLGWTLPLPFTHFCQRLSRPKGHSAAGRINSMKNFNDSIGNRTRDLPACSAVPQPPREVVVSVWYSTYKEQIFGDGEDNWPVESSRKMAARSSARK